MHLHHLLVTSIMTGKKDKAEHRASLEAKCAELQQALDEVRQYVNEKSQFLSSAKSTADKNLRSTLARVEDELGLAAQIRTICQRDTPRPSQQDIAATCARWAGKCPFGEREGNGICVVDQLGRIRCILRDVPRKTAVSVLCARFGSDLPGATVFSCRLPQDSDLQLLKMCGVGMVYVTEDRVSKHGGAHDLPVTRFKTDGPASHTLNSIVKFSFAELSGDGKRIGADFDSGMTINSHSGRLKVSVVHCKGGKDSFALPDDVADALMTWYGGFAEIAALRSSCNGETRIGAAIVSPTREIHQSVISIGL